MGNAATIETTPEEIVQETPQEMTEVNPETAAITNDDPDQRMLAAWMDNNPTPAEATQLPNIDEHPEKCNKPDSVITVDMLNLYSEFECPLCKAAGRRRLINLLTLVEHARYHGTESDNDEDEDESEYTDDESEYSDDDEDEDEDEENAAIEKEVADINAAVRESAMESEIMGNMTEEDALAAALAMSSLDDQKEKLIFAPSETDTIDCNDVNCD